MVETCQCLLDLTTQIGPNDHERGAAQRDEQYATGSNMPQAAPGTRSSAVSAQCGDAHHASITGRSRAHRVVGVGVAHKCIYVQPVEDFAVLEDHQVKRGPHEQAGVPLVKADKELVEQIQGACKSTTIHK